MFCRLRSSLQLLAMLGAAALMKRGTAALSVFACFVLGILFTNVCLGASSAVRRHDVNRLCSVGLSLLSLAEISRRSPQPFLGVSLRALYPT